MTKCDKILDIAHEWGIKYNEMPKYLYVSRDFYYEMMQETEAQQMTEMLGTEKQTYAGFALILVSNRTNFMRVG